MGSPLTWQADTRERRVHLSDAAGTVTSMVVADPYSQWTLLDGKDFELWSRMPERDHEIWVDTISAISDPPGPPRRLVDAPGEVASVSDELPALITGLPLPDAAIATKYDPDASGLEAYSAPASDMDSGKIVIVGVIDQGLNPFHERFSSPSGSRIDYFWQQDAPAQEMSAVPYGRVLDRQQIDAMLAASGGDETAALAELGATPRTMRAASHGTAVTDLVAGYRPVMPEVEERRIVAVSLPPLATSDTSGANLIAFCKSAAQFIFARARAMSLALKKPLPVVLNFSFGFNGGPRDGRFILERVLREQVQIYRDFTRTEFGEVAEAVRVLPAGNAHVSQTHAVGSVDGKRSELDVPLRVQPADRTSSYVEVWIPEGAKGVSLDISAPGQSEEDRLSVRMDDAASAEPAAWVLTAGEEIVGRLTFDRPEPASNAQGALASRFVLAIAPTETVGIDRTPSPFGRWAIAATATFTDKPAQIQAWVHRDDSLGTPAVGVRQAYFDHDAYEAERFDARGAVSVIDSATSGPVRRAGTLSGMATDPHPESELAPIVAAAGRMSARALAPYSSGGDSGVALPIQPPDLAVYVEASPSLPWLHAAGMLSGSSVRFNGTSAAAPVVARRVADLLVSMTQAERAATTPADIVESLLKESSAPDLVTDVGDRVSDKRVIAAASD